jgi:hypothetical protein
MLYKLKYMSICLIWVSSIGCVTIPPMPKFDLGRIRVKENDVRFRNPQGTFFNRPIKDLDGYVVVNPDHLIDISTWLDKVITILKQEMVRK